VNPVPAAVSSSQLEDKQPCFSSLSKFTFLRSAGDFLNDNQFKKIVHQQRIKGSSFFFSQNFYNFRKGFWIVIHAPAAHGIKYVCNREGKNLFDKKKGASTLSVQFPIRWLDVVVLCPHKDLFEFRPSLCQ
jgi:hypothetical protein